MATPIPYTEPYTEDEKELIQQQNHRVIELDDLNQILVCANQNEKYMREAARKNEEVRVIIKVVRENIDKIQEKAKGARDYKWKEYKKIQRKYELENLTLQENTEQHSTKGKGK